MARLTKADVLKKAEDLKNWGKWGPDDELRPELRHARGHRQRRQTGAEGQGLPARSQSRRERAAARPFRRTLEPVAPDAGDGHRCHSRQARRDAGIALRG